VENEPIKEMGVNCFSANETLNTCFDEDGGAALLISGHLLPLILESESLSSTLVEVLQKVKAVIVYRSSPA